VGQCARQFTKLLLSLLSHIGEMVGRHGAAPLCGLRDRCIAAMLATRKRRDAKAELNRRSQACEVLTGTGIRLAKMDEHQGSAHFGLEDRRVSLSNLCSKKWNPVLESHQPLRFCKPPPGLLGRRDRN
jgi:hypothetical protein